MPSFPAQKLLDWFSAHQRPLPWRKSYDPYHVWVSEVMAQQTRMDQLLPYYEKFLQEFPSVKTLADADEQAVLKRWEGLGYYSRAHNLHAAAKEVVNKHQGKVPVTKKELLALKGFGPYISSAVASIAFKEDVPVVDGNVLRVTTRVWGIEDDVSKPATRSKIESMLVEVLPKGHAREFNQAMMELGALVCTPDNPSCKECPLNVACHAFKTNTQEKFPVKTRKGKVPVKHFAMVIIRDHDKLGMVQRTSKLLHSMWEFPSVEFSPLSDSPAQIEAAFQRMHGLHIRLGANRGTQTHQYSHFTQHAHVFDARLTTVAPGMTFLSKEEMEKKPLSKIQLKIVEMMKSIA